MKHKYLYDMKIRKRYTPPSPPQNKTQNTEQLGNVEQHVSYITETERTTQSVSNVSLQRAPNGEGTEQQITVTYSIVNHRGSSKAKKIKKKKKRRKSHTHTRK